MESTVLGGLGAALIANQDLLREFYSDLMKPGVSQVGKAIGNILEVAFLPFEERKEKRRMRLQARMETFRRLLEYVPQEKILPIPPDLGVPVLERLSYVGEDVISQLFVNLLATAANEDTVNMAHPSFIRVIESLSADEAKLLLQFREKKWVVCVEHIEENSNTGERKSYGKKYGRLEDTPDLHYPKNIEAYLSNFVGLGIIERTEDFLRIEAPDRKKVSAETEEIYHELQGEIEQDLSPVVDPNTSEKREEYILRTPYGEMFLRACMRNIEVQGQGLSEP